MKGKQGSFFFSAASLGGGAAGAYQYFTSSFFGSKFRVHSETLVETDTEAKPKATEPLPLHPALFDVNERVSQEADVVLPLRLRLVQVITRHGLRTPLSGIPGDKSVWRCNHQQLSMLAKCEGEEGEDESEFFLLHSEESLPEHIPSHYLFRRQFIFGRQALNGNCYKGQLTSEGLLQMKRLGEELRTRYIDRLRLLSPAFDPKQVYIRSTNSNRTIESAQSLLWGLFPPVKNAPDVAGIMVINMIENRVENMYPRSRCKKITKLRSEAKKTEGYVRHENKIASFKEEVEKAIGREVGSWDALNSTLKSMQAHGFGLPENVTKEMAARVEKEAGWSTAHKFDSTLITRLGIGTFIADVLHNMDTVATQPENPLRFALFSGHDNTLSPFLSAYKVFDGFQPDMASAIVLEQYEDAKGKHFIRFVYKGQDQFLPNIQQMQHLDGWKNVKKWQQHIKQSGLGQRVKREYSILFDDNEHRGEGRTHREHMILYPYEEFKALSSLLIPVNYKEECEI